MKKEDIIILVADDHPMLLKGLMGELLSHGYKVLAGATNGAQALDSIVAHVPSIAILDIEMPLLSGFEVIKKCKEKGSKTKFVVLTSHKEKAFVLKAKKLDISGYLLKDEPFSEIEKCIHHVIDGGNYFSTVFDEIFSQQITPELEKIKFLSPSERTILRLIAREKTSKEIGELLHISHRTVQKHRANVIAKLDLPPTPDALTVWTSENKELLLTI